MDPSDETRRPPPGVTSGTGRLLVCRHCGAALHGDPSCPSCGEQFRIEETDVPVSGLVKEMQERLARALEGRYELRGLLGHGGMGAVFLAVELRLDRLVAIKVLPPTLAADEGLLTRFEREARTAARLDHPGIVPIYSVEDSGDLHFFVMKFVPGTDLTEEIGQGPMPLERVREILLAAARALSHAHERGVIHRDVKPSNIMLDDRGRVVLADFGIAKAAANSQVTSTGQALGSPQYMSPEQFEGREVDGRSDQYGLGMVAYHMLAGQAPFEGSSYGSVLLKQVMEYPPSLKDARPDLPDNLVSAVERAIRKAPEERFPDMEAFATAVAGGRAEESAGSAPRGGARAGAREGSPSARGAGTASRRRGPVAAALVSLAVLSGVAYAVLGGGPGDVDPVELDGSRATASQESGSAGPQGEVGTPLEGTGGAGAGEGPKATDPGTSGSGEETSAAPDAQAGNAAGGSRTSAAAQDPATQGAGGGTPASGVQPERAVQLPPPAVPRNGLLTINAQPVYAFVEVDGIELPNSTPIFQHLVPPGQHVLTIRRQGYQTVVDTVEVTAGNETRRSYVLIAN